MGEVFVKGSLVCNPIVSVKREKRGVYASLFNKSSSWEIGKIGGGLRTGFSEGRLVFPLRRVTHIKPSVVSSPVPRGFSIGPKSMRWWETNQKPNMREIESTQDLVDSLQNAGDKLVVVDFFAPGCPGCKALHPKICQIAEQNPDVLFLQVNYEKHKSMCYSLHVHVLPFFSFFRGAQGRLTGFSCTNQTIKKFRDALAKHSPERCSLGPAKGLDESVLVALSENKELDFSYTKTGEKTEESETECPVKTESPVLAKSSSAEEKELVSFF